MFSLCGTLVYLGVAAAPGCEMSRHTACIRNVVTDVVDGESLDSVSG